MEHIEKIVVGLVLFVATSAVAYLFRMRQLYAAAPKLYKHAPISRAGSICELIIYNRGNQAEEAIQVALDPDLKIELIASSSSDIALDTATLKVERLHKGCEASAMLLVENGLLDHTKILSVSSKAAKGAVFKSVSEVPANYARTFLLFAALIGAFPALIYAEKAYKSIDASYMEYRLAASYKAGWSNLSRYYQSDLRASYSDQEFPLRLIGHEVDSNKDISLTFEVYNKTALPMKVVSMLHDRKQDERSYFASTEVAPMAKGKLTAKLPQASSARPQPILELSIGSGEEYVYGVLFAAP